MFEILEQSGFEVSLVNARHVKNVPGHKTDVNDAQWLQQLHSYGLLRASFRPPGCDRRAPAYLRHRERLVDYAASHIQHMQKALMQMNVQLHHVVTHITGVTGMKIIRAIVGGNQDPAALAQSLDIYEFHQAKIAECDEQIEAVLDTLNADRQAPAEPLSKIRHTRGQNEPRFDVRSALYTLIGADLSQIHGFGPHTVLRLIAECGDDLSKWPTAKHFTSWLCLAPGNKYRGAGCSVPRPAPHRTAPAPFCDSPRSASERLRRRWAPSIAVLGPASGKPRPSPRPPGNWPCSSITLCASG